MPFGTFALAAEPITDSRRNVRFLDWSQGPQLAHPGRLLNSLLHSSATVPLHTVRGGMHPIAEDEYGSARLLPFSTAGFERKRIIG